MATNIKINQGPQTLFVTENIQDPVVRHNFDILNKELLARRKLAAPPAANLVVSNTWPVANSVITFSGTSEFTPGPLGVTITTKGNPVQVKLSPVQFTKGGRFNPEFFMENSSSDNCALKGGFYRSQIQNGIQSTPVKVSQYYAPFRAAGCIFVQVPLALSIFDFVDFNVPSGTWRYQFYLQNDAGTVAALFTACVSAWEMR